MSEVNRRELLPGITKSTVDMPKDNLFIVIEGLDGSGKTTVSAQLLRYLEQAYPDKILKTYEPNNPSCGGEYIRAVLTKQITRFSHRTLALAFAANRLDHGDRQIIPWLEEGACRICLCDRYYLSSLVYQSTDGFSMKKVLKLNELARQPDIIFFLNVSNEVCYERMKIRNQPQELFEQNLTETREKYYKAIQLLRKKKQENIVEIDGNGTIKETLQQMVNVLFEQWPDWKTTALPAVEEFEISD